MRTARLKTIFLTALVTISFVQSYLLWQGNWQTGPGTTFIESPSSLAISSTPRGNTATKPYRIVVQAMKRSSLVLPGDSNYSTWLANLQSMNITDLRPVAEVPTNATATMEFQFGVTLTASYLHEWLPNLQGGSFTPEASRVRLFQASARGPVLVALLTGSSAFLGTTDLGAAKFSTDVNTLVGSNPWRSWQGKSNSWLPEVPIEMHEELWQTSTPSVMPLVRSFFVNTEALTRITANPHVMLWTDGSRAVQIDQNSQTLTFEDPNAPSTGSFTPTSALSMVLTYVRTHGGAPKDSLLFVTPDETSATSNAVFTFRTYLYGFPVSGATGTYVTQTQRNQVAQYTRPLNQLMKPVSQATVRVMDAAELQAVLVKLMPQQRMADLSVDLEYAVVTQQGNQAMLEPVYVISENGDVLYTLHATDAKILQGAGAS